MIGRMLKFQRLWIRFRASWMRPRNKVDSGMAFRLMRIKILPLEKRIEKLVCIEIKDASHKLIRR